MNNVNDPGFNMMDLDANRQNIIKSIIEPKTDREIFDKDPVSISLSPKHILIRVGEWMKIEVNSTPGTANNPNLIWGVIDGEGNVTVSDGIVRGLKLGTAKIKAVDIENQLVYDTVDCEVYPGIQKPEFNVTLSCDPASGTVQGGGRFVKYTKTTIKAIANEGYTFTKWSDDKTDAVREIEVTENLTLTAEFTAL